MADDIIGGPSVGRKRAYPKRNTLIPYMLEHMHDDCPKWPYARGGGGYGKVQYNGKVVDVHRLVCRLVHGDPPTPRHQAAHNCGKGRDGCFGAGCIEWKTPYENQEDRRKHGTMMQGESHYACKLTDADVERIRSMSSDYSQSRIAKAFGISRSYVSQIISGQRR
jgi:hypothetical protein